MNAGALCEIRIPTEYGTTGNDSGMVWQLPGDGAHRVFGIVLENGQPQIIRLMAPAASMTASGVCINPKRITRMPIRVAYFSITANPWPNPSSRVAVTRSVDPARYRPRRFDGARPRVHPRSDQAPDAMADRKPTMYRRRGQPIRENDPSACASSPSLSGSPGQDLPWGNPMENELPVVRLDSRYHPPDTESNEV